MKYEIRVDRYKANLKSMKLDKLIKSSTMRFFSSFSDENAFVIFCVVYKQILYCFVNIKILFIYKSLCTHTLVFYCLLNVIFLKNKQRSFMS